MAFLRYFYRRCSKEEVHRNVSHQLLSQCTKKKKQTVCIHRSRSSTEISQRRKNKMHSLSFSGGKIVSETQRLPLGVL